jgi:hypothetical protein
MVGQATQLSFDKGIKRTAVPLTSTSHKALAFSTAMFFSNNPAV